MIKTNDIFRNFFFRETITKQILTRITKGTDVFQFVDIKYHSIS